MLSSSDLAGLLRLEEHEESNSATAGSAVGTSMHFVGPTFVSSASFGLMLPTQFFEGAQLGKHHLRSYPKYFCLPSLTINSTE
jgi:hypothetical protein